MLLQSFYSNGCKTYQELTDYMETAREHPTGRLWVDCLIKPTLLALMFMRGERNGDYLLQQHCLNEMLPYFFAAGHHNYARYISWYVRQMEHLHSVPRMTYWQARTSVGTRTVGFQCQQISSASRPISSEGRVLEV